MEPSHGTKALEPRPWNPSTGTQALEPKPWNQALAAHGMLHGMLAASMLPLQRNPTDEELTRLMKRKEVQKLRKKVAEEEATLRNNPESQKKLKSARAMKLR